MDTQNTPIHINLWHREFWMLSLANLFLCMAIYMLLLIVPEWLMKVHHTVHWQVSYAFAFYAVGLFFLGGFCSYFVQKYRRNRVCRVGIFIMIVCLYAMTFFHRLESSYVFWAVNMLSFLLGAVFGLVQMVLSSTLIIDVCESFRRTEANYSSSWFGRFALSLGPIAGIIISRFLGFNSFIVASVLLCLAAVLLIYGVKFPFKAPDDNIPLYSLDRFFLPQGKWLFVNLMLVSMLLGVLLSIFHTLTFYGMMLVGFAFAILAQKFVFVNADLKSETVTGLLAASMALLLLLTRRQLSVDILAPALIGFGVSLIASRFQLFFIKLSKHCQRGTSQSSYFLAWESGLALGLSVGWGYLYSQEQLALFVALGLVILAFLYYQFFTHRWYMENKNR